MPFIDLVVGGPDMSGTGTQIEDIISFFQSKGKKVRDMRRTEVDVLFHAEIFSHINQNHVNLGSFLSDESIDHDDKIAFLWQAYELLSGGGTNEDLKIASCVKNLVSSYINPNSSDVWIFEEPTKRAAGQKNRAIEQHRSQYESETDPIAAALSHQNYRIDEFLRFRRVLRQKGKIIIRSRSEESACYQIYHPQKLKNGISLKDYLSLPGHKIAFSHPPTHIFIVCAPKNWTKDEYLELKKQRSGNRLVDDYESKAEYQLLVNFRYASLWVEKLYEVGCALYGAKPPQIIRFDIYKPKEVIKLEMQKALETILEKSFE